MPSVVDHMPYPVTLAEESDTEARESRDRILADLRAAAGITEPWHAALLRAVGQWKAPYERARERDWRYVIGGEALDWLTVAERLCYEIPDVVPPEELEALLFRGELPYEVGEEQFRQNIGALRYTAHLNYWYGVVVEEALQLSVENGIRKNHRARCYQDNESLVEETFRHIYGETRVALAAQFIDTADCLWGGDAETFTLTGYKEFTYWLFKRRLKKWHPARVASDTRRGLEMLRELQNGIGINAAVDALANSHSALALLIPAGKS